MSRAYLPLFFVLTSLCVGCGSKKKSHSNQTSEAYKTLNKQVSESITEDGLVLIEVDINADSKADIFNYYREREEASRLLIKKEMDMNLDGQIDVVSLFNDLGDLTEERMDSNFDGTYDWTDHYQKNRRVMSEVDSDHDGVADTFSYYSKGKITRKNHDTDNDGRIDFWERFDEDGAVTKTGKDTDGDGKMDYREE